VHVVIVSVLSWGCCFQAFGLPRIFARPESGSRSHAPDLERAITTARLSSAVLPEIYPLGFADDDTLPSRPAGRRDKILRALEAVRSGALEPLLNSSAPTWCSLTDSGRSTAIVAKTAGHTRR